jgi:hypothetical protein
MQNLQVLHNAKALIMLGNFHAKVGCESGRAQRDSNSTASSSTERALRKSKPLLLVLTPIAKPMNRFAR